MAGGCMCCMYVRSPACGYGATHVYIQTQAAATVPRLGQRSGFRGQVAGNTEPESSLPLLQRGTAPVGEQSSAECRQENPDRHGRVINSVCTEPALSAEAQSALPTPPSLSLLSWGPLAQWHDAAGSGADAGRNATREEAKKIEPRPAALWLLGGQRASAACPHRSTAVWRFLSRLSP